MLFSEKSIFFKLWICLKAPFFIVLKFVEAISNSSKSPNSKKSSGLKSESDNRGKDKTRRLFNLKFTKYIKICILPVLNISKYSLIPF